MKVLLTEYKLLGNLKNCIYKITNPSGNIYIGKTNRLYNRINKYVNVDCKQQIKLYNSLVFHGISNHTLEVLEFNIKESILKEREIYFISQLNSFKKGLNMTIGGDGYNKYNDLFCNELLKLNQQGYTSGDLSKRFNISRGVIVILIKRVGEFIKNKKFWNRNSGRHFIPEFSVNEKGVLTKVIPLNFQKNNLKNLSEWHYYCNKLRVQNYRIKLKIQ